MTKQEAIKQLDILLSRERYLLGCSSDEHQPSKMIEALEIAKQAVEKSEVKHGEWIMRGGWFRCSECDEKARLRDVGGTGGFSHEYEQIKSNYCPNCGAKKD